MTTQASHHAPTPSTSGRALALRSPVGLGHRLLDWRPGARMAFKMRPVVVAAALAVFQMSEPAMAQSAGTTQRAAYAIGPGPLGDVLAQFAAQAHAPLSFDPATLDGLKSPGLRGRYTVKEGFDALLDGSGYEPEDKGNGAWSVRRARPPVVSADAAGAQPTTLPPVRVTANASRAATRAEALNPETTVGSKVPVAQREIPNSVTVVPQKQLQEQNATTVDDAIKYVPGVTVNLFQPNDTAYYSRGFQISTVQLDGVPTAIPASGGSMTADNVAAYDRVEVLRGPAGLFNGFGGDGGVINLVRKRAPSQFQASVDASVGNYADRRVMADIGGPLNAAGTLRGRVVAMQHDRHEMQEGSWQRDQQVYGTLEADLTPTTLARVGISYSHQFGHVMWGIPTYTDYSIVDVPRSAYIGADWDYMNVETTNAFAEVEQKLGAGWTAKVSYNHRQIHQMSQFGYVGDYVDPTALDAVDKSSFKTLDNNTQDAIDVYASGPFRLFGREHQLTVGANWLHQSDQLSQYYANPDSGLDVWADVYNGLYDTSGYANAFAGGPQDDAKRVLNQYGIYGNARFSITDPLTLIVGGRVTWWHGVSTPNPDPYYNVFGNTPNDTREGPKFTPFVGLVYDINDTYSAYASYTSIYKPQTSAFTVSGQMIKPVTGSQYEVGVKGEYFGGRLNTSLALFQVDERNRAFGDPQNIGFSIAQGRARSRGVELQASGEVLPGLTLSGGYTYTMASSLDDSTSVGAAFGVTTPKHLFKLWSNYQLPGEFHKWSIGAGAYVSSYTYFSDSGNRIVGPGYATFDAHVGYQLTKNMSASLAVTNLANRTYIRTAAGAGGNYYGDPRLVLFSLRAKI
ncbi:TonB-dependent siderophore receptor [Paraburkholderia acidisoli]|uniref:TonB-dependent siderophore receptor n=1 Tax=Paraburkholderia acidisoli TaxID=2571748 RepID=A0A7Z2JHT3_9BURK|nr:TonB-dependent receptor [Paraburkholderia acidisoli]QGZ65061.1 TonB-dependent siderophore receptor [Paraburkholderia acidisoli]